MFFRVFHNDFCGKCGKHLGQTYDLRRLWKKIPGFSTFAIVDNVENFIYPFPYFWFKNGIIQKKRLFSLLRILPRFLGLSSVVFSTIRFAFSFLETCQKHLYRPPRFLCTVCTACLSEAFFLRLHAPSFFPKRSASFKILAASSPNIRVSFVCFFLASAAVTRGADFGFALCLAAGEGARCACGF